VTHKINISSLPEFDASHYLDSEVAIAEYLTAIIDDGDSALLAAALGDIARARGMSEIARSAGLTREALYKALRPNATAVWSESPSSITIFGKPCRCSKTAMTFSGGKQNLSARVKTQKNSSKTVFVTNSWGSFLKRRKARGDCSASS
jgi:probable addiction module antidote protein